MTTIEILRRLRAEFPEWGIIYDGFSGTWVALRGQHLTLTAPDPAELRSRLQRL